MEQIAKTLFYVFTRYFWIFAIIVTSIPVPMARQASKYYIRQDSDLAPGYRKLFRRYLLWMNIPWVVMGIGVIIGKVPSLWHFFKPRDGNPYVLAWFASLVLLMVVVSYWIFFRGGAEMLIKHHGVLSISTSNPTVIKLFWLMFLGVGLVVMVTMWTADFPIPQFD